MLAETAAPGTTTTRSSPARGALSDYDEAAQAHLAASEVAGRWEAGRLGCMTG
jgi:hypothetical protein